MAQINMCYGGVECGSIADVRKFQIAGGRKFLNEMMPDLWQIYLAVVIRSCCGA